MSSSSSSKPADASSLSINKRERAKRAKETINNTLPNIIRSSPRAQAGIENTELIAYSPSNNAETSIQETSVLPKVRVVQSDTFNAAQAILDALPAHSKARVGVLNMASALQPGGGLLNGAAAQEESLCMRSTLYASISTQSYRLPQLSAIYSPDVLIFRSSTPFTSEILPKSQWNYVDVISCAALKNPDKDRKEYGMEVYATENDREIMTTKIRLILQIARQKGITHLVLGALGCGAYKNPIREVAEIFKKVILGTKRRESEAAGIEEIVFAIFDDGPNLKTFGEVLGEAMSG